MEKKPKKSRFFFIFFWKKNGKEVEKKSRHLGVSKSWKNPNFLLRRRKLRLIQLFEVPRPPKCRDFFWTTFSLFCWKNVKKFSFFFEKFWDFFRTFFLTLFTHFWHNFTRFFIKLVIFCQNWPIILIFRHSWLSFPNWAFWRLLKQKKQEKWFFGWFSWFFATPGLLSQNGHFGAF